MGSESSSLIRPIGEFVRAVQIMINKIRYNSTKYDIISEISSLDINYFQRESDSNCNKYYIFRCMELVDEIWAEGCIKL